MQHANELSEIERVVASCHEDCRIVCPTCSSGRRKKNTRDLSVTVFHDRVVYDCHHCPEQGVVYHEKPRDYVAELEAKKKKKVTKLPTKLNEDHDLITQFFERRGVTIEDPSALPIRTGVKYFRDLNCEVEAIGFVYGDRKQPNAVKWRPLDGTKAFTQDGSASEFYGLDMLPKDVKELIIVEGEADVIALASIGIPAISIPNGALAKYNSQGVDPSEDSKFSYVWEAKELIDSAEKIVLAVDNDAPGEALAEELARRIGRARCWRTEFPGDDKDANDTLKNHGKAAVETALDKSEPMPLAGVYTADEYYAALEEVYLKGHAKGETTGLSNIDNIFTIKTGCVYIVTGIPGSGKSEFLDQIMVNLALKRSWKWAVASFENQPHIHMGKMCEKIVGKPLLEGVTPRMTLDEMHDAREYVKHHFVFLQNRGGDLSTMDSIISRTRDAIMRMGCRGLVIDPYNYISISSDLSEHKQIEEMLTKLVSFAQAADIAIFFVAHPMKIYPRDDGTMPVPVGMHISGSAAWFAKADVGITVHRSTAGVEVHCWKMRHKWIGKQGIEFLDYDVPTGRYFVPKDLERRHEEGPGLSKRGRRRKKVEEDRPEDFDDIDLDNLDF